MGGWIILGEAVTPWQWVGAIVVVASLSYFLYRQTRPPPSQPAVDAEAVLLESIGDEDSLHSLGEPASQEEEGDESGGLAKGGAPDALPLLARAQSQNDDREDE